MQPLPASTTRADARPALHSVVVTACSLHNSLASDCDAFMAALASQQLGLTCGGLSADWRELAAPTTSQPTTPFNACLGEVTGLPRADLPGAFDTRQLRLAWSGLQPLVPAIERAAERWGRKRVGLLLGTSTGGQHSSELAFHALEHSGHLPASYSCRDGHAFDAAVRPLLQALQLTGPWGVVSTACSSSAKALAAGRRWLCTGLCDAIVVGGVDSLCLLTLMGFGALGVLAQQPCEPFSATSNGMNVAEGAAWLLLERAGSGIWLVGSGESQDAHHPVAPHPKGTGAAQAIDEALLDAGLAAERVNYVNAHGTGTAANDSVEGPLLKQRFPAARVQSTKRYHGHQLGASGATEAIVCVELLKAAARETVAPEDIAASPEQAPSPEVALSTTLAFGGSNACLVFARSPSQLAPARPSASSPAAGPWTYIQQVSCWAPGWSDPRLPGQCAPNAAAQAEGAQTDAARADAQPAAELLPQRERGRADLLTRMFAECLNALGPRALLQTLPTVYGSTFGPVAVTLELLALQQRGGSSPLRFGASVLNAPAGALSIALGNRAFSTSVAAGAHSVALALLEGCLWLETHPDAAALAVLVGDELPPRPLLDEDYHAFAAGFLLSREPTAALGKLRWLADGTATAPLLSATTDTDRHLLDNPCAPALHALHALAAAEQAPLRLALSQAPSGACIELIATSR